LIRLDVGINSVVGVGFGFGFGVVFQLGVGLALVLALLLSVCDVMVGIGLVQMMLWEALRVVVVLALLLSVCNVMVGIGLAVRTMLWEALRVVVRERQDRCIDRIDGYFYFYSCSMVDFQSYFYSYAPQGDALQQGT